MAMLKHISFLQVFLPSALLLVLLSALAAPVLAHGPVSRFCDQATPGQERDMCNALVNNARTWEEAMRNVLHASLRASRRIKPMIRNIKGTLPQSLRPVSKDSIALTCRDALGTLLDGFRQALGELTNDPGTLGTDLNAAATGLSDCIDGLDEFGASSPGIQKAHLDMLKYAGIALAVASHQYKELRPF